MASLHARLSSDAMFAAGAVDLSRVQFVRPGGLVCLSSLIETWTMEDRPLEVRLPPDGVTGYMQRMAFLRTSAPSCSTTRM
jgi:hypothetical protein